MIMHRFHLCYILIDRHVWIKFMTNEWIASATTLRSKIMPFQVLVIMVVDVVAAKKK